MFSAYSEQPDRSDRPEQPSLEEALRQIREDAAHGRFADWGWSTIIDEHMQQPIIHQPLFYQLHEAAGIDAHYPIGNAGVLHVYGYWFSTLLTAYGYKWQRWQDGHLATALGLSADAFHLHREGSTLLERVTAATLPVLRGEALPEQEAPTESPAASSAAPNHVAASRNPALHGSADVVVDSTLTRVVVFGMDEASALIYGLDQGRGMQLITTFPLGAGPDGIIEEFKTDRRLHWNAAIPDASSPDVHLNVDI